MGRFYIPGPIVFAFTHVESINVDNVWTLQENSRIFGSIMNKQDFVSTLLAQTHKCNTLGGASPGQKIRFKAAYIVEAIVLPDLLLNPFRSSKEVI